MLCLTHADKRTVFTIVPIVRDVEGRRVAGSVVARGWIRVFGISDEYDFLVGIWGLSLGYLRIGLINRRCQN
jgi:hypothetical protein